ncbi:hypothetical protein GOBAR_DD26166 [Gossypium barbadense]|nr:hypothetical protein GOBAR_DD26166 [Gossypium barbadense]
MPIAIVQTCLTWDVLVMVPHVCSARHGSYRGPLTLVPMPMSRDNMVCHHVTFVRLGAICDVRKTMVLQASLFSHDSRMPNLHVPNHALYMGFSLMFECTFVSEYHSSCINGTS